MSSSKARRSGRHRSFLAPLLETGRRWEIGNVDTGRVIADHVLTAFDSETRRTGLLKHHHLPDGHALIIAPSNAVHTFFMKFAIDLVFVTREGRVLSVRSDVGPWRIAASLRAHAVIELAAGTAQRTGTVRGHVLAIRDASEDAQPFTASPSS